ncbi:MAG: hypothetical protein ACT4OY_07490 [Alphaproteobacteria bacterium]
MKNARLKNIILCLSLLALCTGCAAAIGASFISLFRNDVNVRQTNYAAADYMTQYMKAFVDEDYDLIRAESLQDADQPALNTEIGQIIIGQVGERLRELGYNVDLMSVSTVANRDIYPPAGPHPSANPKFILSGTYINRRGRDIDVRLRLVEIPTGMVRASYDYTLPLTHDLRKKAKPEAKIMRVEP